MDERGKWIDIIAKLYRDLHMSKGAMHGMSESDKKRDKILNYFERLEKLHQRVSESRRKSDLKLLKKLYYNLYVIKPEDIPDSYFEREKRIMRERGFGDVKFSPLQKQSLIRRVTDDQKESLDKWIEYFLFDEDSKHYAMWEKYWVFQGLQNLGKFNKETGKFSRRDKHTVYPFPLVDRKAIFMTLNLMRNFIKGRQGQEEIRSALGSGHFKTLYEYSIKSIMEEEKQNDSIDGKWVKYEQGSDYNILRASLQGYHTGWCTAVGDTWAKMDLAMGDFYIYYTLDENGEAKVPRIAIRMYGHDKIVEIRGIDSNQHMEPEMIPILDKKLEEFPDRDKYRKTEYDMQLLTTIDHKVQKGYALNTDELRFLYEIDGYIQGFGGGKDPRIDEIRGKRGIKEDLINIFNGSAGEEDGSIEDKRIKVHNGNLMLNFLDDANGLVLPEVVNGDLYLNGLINVNGLVLPETVNGSLYLVNLLNTEGLNLPIVIKGNLSLPSLTSARGLVLPRIIGGNLYLDGLTSAEYLVLPDIVNGELSMEGLVSAKGLVLPKKISSLYLSGLQSAEGLILPADFPLERLYVSDEIKDELKNHPEEYYKDTEETLEDEEVKGKHFR